MDWLIGLLAGLSVAGAAYMKRSLSVSGAVAAVVMGTVMVAVGTLFWFGLLLAFFFSSTFWSRWKRRRKQAVEDLYEKTGRRDAGQVMANGGLGLVLCIVHAIRPDPVWAVAFVGVMAAVNADTWATEIGAFSRGEPRSIVTGQNVPKGASGGVSPLGLAASAAGAAFIGAAAWLLVPGGSPFGGLPLVMIATVAGFAGSLADSLIGAKWQRMYRCPVCGAEMEKNRHCGVKTLTVRGSAWLNNDAVNLLSSAAGGAVAVLVYLLAYSR